MNTIRAINKHKYTNTLPEKDRVSAKDF